MGGNTAKEGKFEMGDWEEVRRNRRTEERGGRGGEDDGPVRSLTTDGERQGRQQ